MWAEGGRWGEGQGGDRCSSSKGGGPIGSHEVVEAFVVAMFASAVSFAEVACAVVVSVPGECSFVSFAVAACGVERLFWQLFAAVVGAFVWVAAFCLEMFLKC